MNVEKNAENAARFAELALACVAREFPYQPAHVVRGADDLKRPRALHPAFYGCYDWHSSVHGHWLLAHLLRRQPPLPQAGAIRRILDEHLTAENLRVEAEYLTRNPGFERPYGWAWLLKLAEEAEPWRPALRPLADTIEARHLEWLPKQTYPIRSGTHTNTAFGLAFALDYAQAFDRRDLESLVIERSLTYYGQDRDYPAAWEPGGNDFFSPCLVEADLMRRVLPDFPRWFAAFLPEIPPALLEPAIVGDRSDGQLAHLDGLNLSRAWCYFNLAAVLPEKKVLRETAEKHLQAGLAHVASGSYAGEHWLATFAAYALACAFDGATSTPASRSSATWRE
jgi:hypothetical protein